MGQDFGQLHFAKATFLRTAPFLDGGGLDHTLCNKEVSGELVIQLELNYGCIPSQHPAHRTLASKIEQTPSVDNWTGL